MVDNSLQMNSRTFAKKQEFRGSLQLPTTLSRMGFPNERTDISQALQQTTRGSS
jgi:hypothetical protein